MILVDADSCPVKDIILDIAKKYNIGVRMYLDQSHVYESDYAEVKIVEKGHDSVDLYIIQDIKERDIVVTQDYGLSALVLAKRGFPITPNGIIFTNENINLYLDMRYMGSVMRSQDKHIKGPKKRTKQNDDIFKENLIKLITLENV